MNEWRSIKVTIVVEVAGEQPLQLTHTYNDLHISSSHLLIEHMADAFRIQADDREMKKLCNEKRMPMVSNIKRVPYSQWAGTGLEGREVVLSKIDS